MRSVIYGTAAVIHDGFDPDRVGRSLEDGVTLVSLVATHSSGCSRPAWTSCGRARSSSAVARAGGRARGGTGRGATVVQTYGMTETARR